MTPCRTSWHLCVCVHAGPLPTSVTPCALNRTLLRVCLHINVDVYFFAGLPTASIILFAVSCDAECFCVRFVWGFNDNDLCCVCMCDVFVILLLCLSSGVAAELDPALLSTLADKILVAVKENEKV